MPRAPRKPLPERKAASRVARQVRAHVADQEAGRHLALHAYEPHDLLVWKAFKAYRKEGVRVPEGVLARLDALAAAAHKDKGSRDRLRRLERRRDIVHAVVVRRYAWSDLGSRDSTDDEKRRAFAEVAEHYGTSVANVKTVFSRWISDKRKTLDTGATEAAALISVMHDFAR